MTTPIAILVVDEDQELIDAIRRIAHQRWDVTGFTVVPSAAAALSALNGDRFDVVITNLRLPAMDGAELLAEVKTRFPATTRIVLSGYVEDDVIFKAAKVAHRYLHKPCEADEIARTIEEVERCHQAIDSDAMVAMIGRIENLPTLGDVYFDLMDAVAGDDWSPADLAEIVSRDVGITVELLRLVNSGFFGLSRTVHSVEQAITFLGLDVVRAAVAGYSLFNEVNNAPNIDIEEVAARSRSAALLACKSVSSAGGTRSEAAEAYLAGIVHEVGALALSAVSEVERDALQAALAGHDVVTERLVLGADRYSVSQYLLGLWGFSPSMCEAVASLARPMPDSVDPLARGLHRAKRAAELGLLISDGDDLTADEMDDLLARLDLDLSQLADQQQAASPAVERA